MSSTSFRRRALRRIAVPLTAAAVATGVAAALATPAAASNSYNGRAYIYGAGSPKDDLNDEGAVNESTNTVSNVTCLWQSMLWVDGYLPKSGIDGSFGPQTYAATKKWQTAHGLASDGSAGKLTFKKAGARVTWKDYPVDQFLYGTYANSKKTKVLQIYRVQDGGNWHFFGPDGYAESTSYDKNEC